MLVTSHHSDKISLPGWRWPPAPNLDPAHGLCFDVCSRGRIKAKIRSKIRSFCLPAPDCLNTFCEMQIHIARNGQPAGPFSLEEINRQLAAGTLSLSDQAWYEGAAGWAPLSTVPGVSGGASASPLSATTPSAPAVVTSPAGDAVIPVTGPPAPTEPLAILSLVLSLLGMFGFCCTPVVLGGIAGVVCGHIALSRIKARPDLQGHGLAVAGLVIGYFAIVGWLLWVLLFGGLAVMQGIMQSISK